jgi:hypothetical protein
MPDLKMEPLWVLKLTSRELTLIRAALRDELPEEDDKLAVELEKDLARRVVNETKMKLGQNAKLEQNLDKKA